MKCLNINNFFAGSLFIIMFYCVIMVLVEACSIPPNDHSLPDSPNEDSTYYENIAYPVRLHFIEREGMRYMIASGRGRDGGTSMVNLTLDSLQVEYYKQRLIQVR